MDDEDGMAALQRNARPRDDRNTRRGWHRVLQRMEECSGKDNRGNRTRWDDAVFPGKNWALQFLCTDEAIEELKKRFDELSADPYVKESGIAMYVAEAERAF